MAQPVPAELQQKVNEYSRELSVLRAESGRLYGQIRAADYEHKSNTLSLKELANISTPLKPTCYSAFGKMFIREEFDQLVAQIEQSNAGLEGNLDRLMELHGQVEERLRVKQQEFDAFLQKSGLILKPMAGGNVG